MANDHGGARRGAGRPKGAKNKATAAREEAVKASGLTPLDYLLSIVRDKSKPEEQRTDAAKAAAPYCHPRLSQVDSNVRVEKTHEEAVDELLAGLPEELDEETETRGTA